MIFFLLTSLLLQTQEINVYVSNRKEKIAELEKQILTDVIDLYNQKNKGSESLKLKFIILNTFAESFSAIDNAKNDNLCVVNTVSITPERMAKYDFSESYIPTRQCILGLQKIEYKLDAWQAKGTKIATTKSTTGEKKTDELVKKYNINKVSYPDRETRVQSIFKKEADYVLGDNLLAWENPDLKIIYEFPETFKVGIMFKKSSTLKTKLEKTINYYLKSNKFHQEVSRILGDKIGEYFQKNL
jgi:ABC-type amino acid transport substrate-binding protein